MLNINIDRRVGVGELAVEAQRLAEGGLSLLVVSALVVNHSKLVQHLIGKQNKKKNKNKTK